MAIRAQSYIRSGIPATFFPLKLSRKTYFVRNIVDTVSTGSSIWFHPAGPRVDGLPCGVCLLTSGTDLWQPQMCVTPGLKKQTKNKNGLWFGQLPSSSSSSFFNLVVNLLVCPRGFAAQVEKNNRNAR